MLNKFLDRLEEWLIAALIGAATVITFVAVVHRYGSGNAADLALQRALLAAHPLAQRRDAAQLGVRAGREDHSGRGARHTGSAGEDQLAGVQQRHMGVPRGGVTTDGQRLTGQRGHIDVNSAVEEPDIRGDPFALLDQQHVPRDKLTRQHGLLAAIAHHPCLLWEVGSQRLDRADRLTFLGEREQRVQRDNGEDRPSQGGRPRHERQQPGRPQQQGQRMTHLPGQLTPPRLRGAARQLVRANDLQAARGFPAGQPAGVAAQARSGR